MRTLAFTLFVIRASGQGLSLQGCDATKPAGHFVQAQAGGPVVDGNGKCLGGATNSGDAVSAVPCDGSASQRWAFLGDGTVKGVSLCWNADGGQTSQGTPIVLYQCGVERGGAAADLTTVLAANDIFHLREDGTILGDESGLCVSSVATPVPPPPPANGTCTTAMDCSLSGECVAGLCQCYPPWTGAKDCSALEFLPSPLVRGFPPPSHNETTWGGSIAYDAGTAMYHMYVAEMVNECPLNTWGQNSRCTHAVSATPEGPYNFVDVAVTNWCHSACGCRVYCRALVTGCS